MADLRDEEEFKTLVLKRLDRHSQELNASIETTRLVKDLARTVGEVDKQVKKNKEFLFGNGQPGIDEQLRNINRIGKWLLALAVPVVLYVINFFIDKLLHIPISP